MLYVYRASAGSGKTHLLTGFYIQLLFRPEMMPDELRRPAFFDEILAVTFTNKATAEMKERIVQELNLLATDPRRSDYWTQVNPDGELSPEAVSRMARRLLTGILNDYSAFQISTIDAFFQRIVRAFARELNVPGNYEIELNAERVLDAAVTQFLSHLDASTDPTTYQWLVQFSQGRIEDGSGWNIQPELRKLANVLVTEAYRSHAQRIEAFTGDKQRLAAYTQQLRLTVRRFQQDLQRAAQAGVDVLTGAGLDATMFKNSGKGVIPWLYKWANGADEAPKATFARWAESQDEWYKKGQPRLDEAAATPLQQALQDIAALFDGPRYSDYLSALVILPNIYQLGLLGAIDREARDYCADQGIMLLSSTTEMLRQLVGTDDAPFIYEKTGTRIRSYMIDEFQDTSGMQWDNFRPLLRESLATDNPNLIVGDVKQSIYRWRGSDWGLLGGRLAGFMPEAQRSDDTTLRTNYRSRRAVVQFNNTFFAALADRLGVGGIYGDVEQQVRPVYETGEAGSVEVMRVPAEGGAQQQREAQAAALPQVIMRLQDQGYRASDIAILCRTGSLCALAAEALLAWQKDNPGSRYVMDIISSEALRLGARPAVQAVIALMQHLRDPHSPLLRAVAACSLYQLHGMTPAQALLHPLPDSLEQLAHRPLYEVLEGLVALLPAGGDDAPFIDALRDIVLEFVTGRSASLSAFLDWWSAYGDTRSITTPEGQDAIHILTIHKAKGLAWPVVIVPHAAWDIDISPRAGELLWVEEKLADSPDDEPLVLPVTLTAKLAKTRFADAYAEERQRTIVDNLNTAYVAFTRPKERLIIMVPDKAEGSKKKTEGDTIPPLDALLKEMVPRQEAAPRAQADAAQPAAAEAPLPPADAAETANPAAAAQDAPQNAVGTLPHLSLRRSERMANDAAIERGNRIHQALAEAVTLEDLEAVLDALGAPLDAEQRAVVAPWFSADAKVLNERSILTPTGSTYRPDRVVIMQREGQSPQVAVVDYKTGQPDTQHHRQVARYAHLLQQMGFAGVKGYLWYIEPHRIIPVT